MKGALSTILKSLTSDILFLEYYNFRDIYVM
jgi:hypothetical protein